MNIGLFFFLAFVVVIIRMFVAKANREKADAAWAAAGKSLGLKVQKPRGGHNREMTGRVDGYPVKVESVKEKKGNSRKRVTVYRVTWTKRRHGFSLSRAGALSSVASILGAQDVEVGSEEFDRVVLVKAERPKDVKTTLTPLRQIQVLSVLQKYPGAVIKNGQVKWKPSGLATKADQIEEAVRAFTKLARVMATDEIRRKDSGPDVMPDSRAFREEVDRSAWDWKRGNVPNEVPEPESKSVYQDPRSKPIGRDDPAIELGTSDPVPSVRGDDAHMTQHTAPLEPVRQDREEQPREPLNLKPIPFPVPVRAAPEPIAQPAESEPPLAPQPDRQAAAANLAAANLAAANLAAANLAAAEPAAAVPATAEPADVDLTAAAVGDDLFADNPLGSRVKERFEQHYKDHTVRWSGKLDRVESYYSDFVFGSTQGAKAHVEVHELDGGTYGNATVTAVVQLSESDGASLRPTVGKTFTFEGQLIKCEPYMRNLMVAHGRLV